MTRLPRILPSVLIACCSVALPVFGPSWALAEDPATKQDVAAKPADTPAADAAKPAVDKSLIESVDTFWHYAKTFRYDLASGEAKKIVDAKPDAVTLLQVFQSVAQDRKDDLDVWMLRWQQVPELQQGVDQLLAILNQGHSQQRSDLKIIDKNIQRLIVNEQAYALAIAQLRDSGELAVSPMIDYLRDPNKKQYHAAIRRAMGDMGKTALSPLVASLDMPANDRNLTTLTTVISALGDIGYDVSVAPMAAIAANTENPAVVQQAAKDSLLRMGAGEAWKTSPASLYYDIAQKYYYGKAATSADLRNKATSYWMWNEAAGLVRKDVPSAIYNDLMTLRAARKSLQIDPNRDETLSLWLAADYGREVRLPEGASDPTLAADQPKAHYYGVAFGTKYLNAVINRTLGDHDTRVALAAIKSLSQIGGQSNLFAGGQSGALVSAMQYPDRVVRFESAFAAASALPQTPFEGQDRVTPILGEAVAQTGKPYVLVVMPEDKLNAKVQELKDAGYVAMGATSAVAALAVQAPAIDAIVISDDNPAEVENMRKLASTTPRLEGAALVICTQTGASPFAIVAATNPLVSVTQAAKPEDLKVAIEAGRKKAGSLPMDEKIATDYALRAADLLGRLAISHSPVLDLSAAQSALLQTINDSRPELVAASARVLAQMNSKPAQQQLLLKATDAKTDEKARIVLFNALATSAKTFGNQLEADQLKALQTVVSGEQNLEVRSAAAEAHGALNLPAEQVKATLLK